MLYRLKALVAGLALAVLLPAMVAAAVEPPKQVIESFYASLLKSMHEGPQLGYKGRYELLTPTIDKTFNVPLMAQASVGSYWDKMSAQQRQDLVAAFRAFTISNYAHNFDDFGGERLVTGDAKETSRKEVIVYSTIIKSDGDKVAINYLLRPDGNNENKVIDVFLGGSISQLATRRSEYTSLIRRSGVDALVAAIRKKTAEMAN